MQEDIKPPVSSAPEDKRIVSDAEDVLPLTTIKKEPNSGDEIKEFAETAMNELLGCWYGYEKTDRMEFKTRISRQAVHSGDSSDPESPKYSDGDKVSCGWCNRTMDSTPPVSSASGAFCSELCFSQLRRATFKRNKTCDWCRHVRHTVSYVDIQEGARQLQFCSDKCLNQYKMHIFCRETRAHLELHPHLHRAPADDSTLITPDMWLKDCRDSVSPKPMVVPETTVTESPNRRRLPPRKLHSSHRRRSTRSSTVTSADELSMQFQSSMDSPQDLRVRPRDTEKAEEPKKPSKPPEATPPRIPLLDIQRPVPPITVLVPYPVIIPLPLPIPIPIPIGKLPVNTDTSNVHIPMNKIPNMDTSKSEQVEEQVKTSTEIPRTLRKRKRPNDLSKNNKKSIPV